MKKTVKRMATVLAAAMMAAAMALPASAAEAPLLETKNGTSVDNTAAKGTSLSEYNAYFTAIGATAEQAKSIYLAGTVNLQVGESVDLLLAQPARAADANASLELLVGKQMAVSVNGPADGQTVKNANGEYLPLTFTGKANGTDIYVASIAPYDLRAYQFVVGTGKGVTNTDPNLYVTQAAVVEKAEAVAEEAKVINYNPAPVGAALNNSGSDLLSQGGVKVAGKQVNGVNIYGHAQYSPSAKVEAPKQVRVGLLNPEEIILVENTAKAVARSEPKADRIGLLNAEEIITVENGARTVGTSEPKNVRIGLLNEEQVISIANGASQVGQTEQKPSRIGMLNEEEIISIANSSAQVGQTQQQAARLGLLNEEEIIKVL